MKASSVSSIRMSLPARSITQPGRTITRLRSSASQTTLTPETIPQPCRYALWCRRRVALTEDVERLLDRVRGLAGGRDEPAGGVVEADVLGLDRP